MFFKAQAEAFLSFSVYLDYGEVCPSVSPIQISLYLVDLQHAKFFSEKISALGAFLTYSCDLGNFSLDILVSQNNKKDQKTETYLNK